jgi:hypothetical protein
MDDKLRAWFDARTDDQRCIADALRTLVVTRAPTLTEAIKWGQPCYTGAAMVCYIQKAKGHVSLGFGRGVDLPDPDGLLEGSGGQLRHVKVPLGQSPDAARIGPLIDAAVARDGR